MSQVKATLKDLELAEEKAELIGGKIVSLTSTGRRPNRVGHSAKGSSTAAPVWALWATASVNSM
jgi:hypothetical protein